MTADVPAARVAPVRLPATLTALLPTAPVALVKSSAVVWVKWTLLPASDARFDPHAVPIPPQKLLSCAFVGAVPEYWR